MTTRLVICLNDNNLLMDWVKNQVIGNQYYVVEASISRDDW